MKTIITCLIFLLLPLFAHAGDTLSGRLQNLVDIPSGTNNREGVLKVQKWLSQELQELGFKVSIDENNLLVGILKGSSSKQDKYVNLLMHADTVFEESSGFLKWQWVEDPKKATGPGVIDDKGGIIVALEGLKKFLSHEKPAFSLRVISSPAEETGSPMALPVFRELAKNSWLTLGFEPALDNGSIVESRKGNQWYDIKVTGKEAHAGRSFKDGANACLELSLKLAEISKLTDEKKGLTVSIGHMEGGKDKFNIVCGMAQAKVDVRFATLEDGESVRKKISQILNHVTTKGTTTRFSLADDCPSFSAQKRSQDYVQKYLAALRKVEGRELHAEKSGGSADANYFSNASAIVIDGLGPIGGKMHTNEEFIDVTSLESRAQALSVFLESLEP